MTTWADITARVADDLDRPDLGTQIDVECQRAVRMYQKKEWWFNVRQITLTATTAQANYTLSASNIYLETVELQRSPTQQYPLKQVSWQRYMDSWRYNQGGTGTGQPIEWAEGLGTGAIGGQLWLGPVPNASYNAVLTHRYVILASYSANTDNVWTNFAEEAIVARAERLIGARLLGYSQAAVLALLDVEREAYKEMQRLNEQKITVGTVRPWDKPRNW